MADRRAARGLARSWFGGFSLLGTIAALVLIWPLTASAEQPAPGEAWKSSPFHGAINGATGRPIPCVCRYKARDYRLGEAVCMQTHLGVMIAKCDLLFNNTTWAPTDQPCTLSARPVAAPRG